MYRLIAVFLFFTSLFAIAQTERGIAQTETGIAQTKLGIEQVVTVADKSFLKRDFEQPAAQAEQDPEENRLRQDIFYFSQVNTFILRALVEDYAKQNQIEPEPAHIAGFKQVYANAGLTEEKLNSLAYFNALRFAVDKSLFNQFEGRVVFDQGHPNMPIEAYTKLLMAYKKMGRLVFHEQKYETLFWQSLERPGALDIPSADVKFDAPWWMRVAR